MFSWSCRRRVGAARGHSPGLLIWRRWHEPDIEVLLLTQLGFHFGKRIIVFERAWRFDVGTNRNAPAAVLLFHFVIDDADRGPAWMERPQALAHQSCNFFLAHRSSSTI